MKNLLTIILFATLFLTSFINLHAQGVIWTSDKCNKELCMTIEDLGCDLDGNRCFLIQVTSNAEQSQLGVYFEGALLKTCENTNFCEIEYCTNTGNSPSVDPKYFGCSNDLMQDGCVVTIEPCK